jgi:hypothetical protein
MKICKIMWSVNRPEYLIPSLESSKELIDWGDHEVDGIFIDDMPTNRDDAYITKLAKDNGYTTVILHTENKGLSASWKESYELIRGMGYDFLWHQEDDIRILKPVKIDDIIEYLNDNDSCYQVMVARQTDWYNASDGNMYKDDELHTVKWKTFNTTPHISKGIFSASNSLTKAHHYIKAIDMWLRDEVFVLGARYKIFCEGYIAGVMTEYKKKVSTNTDHWGITFCTEDHDIFASHIGEWTWGKRVPIEYLDGVDLTNDWICSKLMEQLNNPTEKISSRTWMPLSDNPDTDK